MVLQFCFSYSKMLICDKCFCLCVVMFKQKFNFNHVMLGFGWRVFSLTFSASKHVICFGLKNWIYDIESSTCGVLNQKLLWVLIWYEQCYYFVQKFHKMHFFVDNEKSETFKKSYYLNFLNGILSKI